MPEAVGRHAFQKDSSFGWREASEKCAFAALGTLIQPAETVEDLPLWHISARYSLSALLHPVHVQHVWSIGVME